MSWSGLQWWGWGGVGWSESAREVRGGFGWPFLVWAFLVFVSRGFSVGGWVGVGGACQQSVAVCLLTTAPTDSVKEAWRIRVAATSASLRLDDSIVGSE